MAEKMVAIKNMDAATWHQIRVEAVQREMPVAALIRDMWRAYLLEKGREKRQGGK